jgi:succinate dehydrogenase hydrophobic anchor subunit
MEWTKFLSIIAVIFILLGLLQLYLFKKEFNNLDKEQIMPEEFSKKWVNRMTLVIASSVLGAILGLIAITLDYFYN